MLMKVCTSSTWAYSHMITGRQCLLVGTVQDEKDGKDYSYRQKDQEMGVDGWEGQEDHIAVPQ